jgi:hypothetical protein
MRNPTTEDVVPRQHAQLAFETCQVSYTETHSPVRETQERG